MKTTQGIEQAMGRRGRGRVGSGWTIAALVALAGTTAAGCGATTRSVVEKLTTTSVGYGAPKNKTYTADVEVQRDTLRVTVYEASQCEKFEVGLVERTELTEKGGEVIRQQPLGTVQRTGKTLGTVPCDEKYAREVAVGLRIGDAVYELGRTNRFGQLESNLSDEIQQSLYGGNPRTSTATLVVTGREGATNTTQEVAKVSLAELNKAQARLSEVTAELSALLGKGYEAMTPADFVKADELYMQLGQLAPNDARVIALRREFVNVMWGRQALEKSKNLGRDMAALGELRTLAGDGGVALPMFLRIGIGEGELGGESVDWALGQTAVAFGANPTFCQGVDGMNWAVLNAGNVPAMNRVAFNVLRFAYGDGFVSQLVLLCQRLR